VEFHANILDIEGRIVLVHVLSTEGSMSSTLQVKIHEGGPKAGSVNGQRWIRLVVRKPAYAEDAEAECLLREFAAALETSEFRDEFILSIFRIGVEKAPTFGVLPKIENKPGREGIEEVRRYLKMYSEDVQVPLTI
jgi:hypothetical protein